MIIPGGQGGGGGRRRASATPLGKLPALAPGVPASCPPNFPPQAPYKPSQGLMAQPGAVPKDKQGSFCAQPRRPDGPQGGTWGRCPCHPDGKLGKLRVRGFGLPWGAVPCHQHPEQDEPALPLATGASSAQHHRVAHPAFVCGAYYPARERLFSLGLPGRQIRRFGNFQEVWREGGEGGEGGEESLLSPSQQVACVLSK